MGSTPGDRLMAGSQSASQAGPIWEYESKGRRAHMTQVILPRKMSAGIPMSCGLGSLERMRRHGSSEGWRGASSLG
jgi:hypothetical protein